MIHEVLAFYLRLSSEDDDLRTSKEKVESNSITNQRKLLKEYQKAHDDLLMMDTLEFCDDGYSGTNFNRPAFQEMMVMVRNRQIQCIMVKDLSRFGREFLEVSGYLELILPMFGTRFISVNDHFDSGKYGGTTGGLELALHNLINGMYAKDTSVKIKTAVATRNRRGDYWGGAAFYGYLVDPANRHHLIVNEEVRDVIVLIYELCIDGLSTMQIAKRLNEMGVPSPAEYKAMKGMFYNGRKVERNWIWLGGTVRIILTDRRYTGVMLSGRRQIDGINSTKTHKVPENERIMVKGTHEAIISEDTFERAAMALAGRVKTINANTAGDRKNNLFLCGYCGRRLALSNGKQAYYYCMKSRTVPNASCAALQVDSQVLQMSVVQVLKTHISVMSEKSQLQALQSNEEENRLRAEEKYARKRLSTLAAMKSTSYEEYRSGRYTKEGYIALRERHQSEKDSLEKQLAEIQTRLEQIHKQKDARARLRADTNLLLPIENYDPAVVRQFVDAIRVYKGGRIEIDFCTQESFEIPKGDENGSIS